MGGGNFNFISKGLAFPPRGDGKGYFPPHVGGEKFLAPSKLGWYFKINSLQNRRNYDNS
jgi:hypothetical protein